MSFNLFAKNEKNRVKAKINILAIMVIIFIVLQFTVFKEEMPTTQELAVAKAKIMKILYPNGEITEPTIKETPKKIDKSEMDTARKAALDSQKELLELTAPVSLDDYQGNLSITIIRGAVREINFTLENRNKHEMLQKSIAPEMIYGDKKQIVKGLLSLSSSMQLARLFKLGEELKEEGTDKDYKSWKAASRGKALLMHNKERERLRPYIVITVDFINENRIKATIQASLIEPTEFERGSGRENSLDLEFEERKTTKFDFYYTLESDFEKNIEEEKEEKKDEDLQ